MPTCKGNLGNLMQHWVLCEIVANLSSHLGPDSHTLFISTHSMAPGSMPSPSPDQTRDVFDKARNRLGPRCTSAYEKAWNSLSPCAGLPYPSSALFVDSLHKQPISMVLCEVDPVASSEINTWMASISSRGRAPAFLVQFGGGRPPVCRGLAWSHEGH